MLLQISVDRRCGGRSDATRRGNALVGLVCACRSVLVGFAIEQVCVVAVSCRCAAVSTPAPMRRVEQAGLGYVGALTESLLVAVQCPRHPASCSVSLIVSPVMPCSGQNPSLTALQCGIGALVGRLLGALDEVLPWRVLLRLALAWGKVSVSGSWLMP